MQKASASHAIRVDSFIFSNILCPSVTEEFPVKQKMAELHTKAVQP